MSALAALTPAPRAGTNEGQVVASFLAGYAGLWVILTLMTESPRSSGLAAAFAFSIAAGATVLYLTSAAENIGLLPQGPAAAPATPSTSGKSGLGPNGQAGGGSQGGGGGSW